jgi:glycosyltransferase involved in cell wall biosynthesis
MAKIRMKILYGITKSNFGGAQRYVYELARESKHRGHDTAVLLGGHGVLTEKLDSRAVRVISLPHLGRDIRITKDIRAFIDIWKILRREKPDVFHINSSKMAGIGAVAARFAGVKRIIFTAHGWEFNGPGRKYQKIFLKTLYWVTILASDLTICVSEKTKRDVESWPFVKNKLAVVHNGIAHFDYLARDEARKQLGLKEDTYVVGTIAELRRIKGLDILLTAWADFSKNRNVTLVIIGAGEEEENLTSLAKKLGISQTVYFAGFIDNARKFMKAFDVFVLASRSEALPYAPLEAGLAGLPVIATSVGGVPEIIKEDETGLLIQPEFPEELRHVLDGLRRDAELRKRLGDSLKKFVEKEYSLEQMFDRTFALY